METEEQKFIRILDEANSLSDKDRKDLAEDLLVKFEYDGWEVVWSYPDLMVVKTTEL